MSEPQEQIVTRPEQLPEVCAHLRSCARFGFDTEFVGEESFRPHLCLIQAATEERLILIDPFTVGPLDEFWSVVVDPAHQAVIHAAREEIRHCHLWAGREPGNIFDTQIAGGLVGLHYPMSFGALVSHLLGIRLTKTETLTEWRDRPLSPLQLQYAFDDVRYLLPMWHELNPRLERLGRSAWAQEEFARSVRTATDESAVLEKWRKLKGIGHLDRRQLAIAREIYLWRESVADRLNRPPRTICRDDLIVEIARRRIHRPRDLETIRGLQRRDIEAIFAAVERARAIPIEQCPERGERENDPPQVAMLTSFLSAVLGHLANEMQLAPNLAASTNDLKLLVRSRVLHGTPVGDSLLNEGWRLEHIRPRLERVLDGADMLRIVKPQDLSPFEIRSDSGRS